MYYKVHTGIEVDNRYRTDDFINAISSFHEMFGETDAQWNMSANHLKTVAKIMHSDGLPMWSAGFSGNSTLFGYPIVISDCNKITISERQIIPEPLAANMGDIVSFVCNSCAAPLKTMTCEYCGTVHKGKRL